MKRKKRNFLLKFEPTFRFGDKVQLRLGKGSCTFPGRGTTVKAALNSVCKTKVFFCSTSSGVHLGQSLLKMSLKISQSYIPYLDFKKFIITEYSNSKSAMLCYTVVDENIREDSTYRWHVLKLRTPASEPYWSSKGNFTDTRKVAAFGGLSSIRTKGHIQTKGHSSYKNEVISKSFLFMGNMNPYYFKTIFRLCVKHIPSFIKIGGAVSEKNGDIGQTFVVLYVGLRWMQWLR